MRQNLLHYDSNSNEPPQRTNPSIEISSSYLNANDSAIKMFDHLNFNDFSNDLEDDMHADHFFFSTRIPKILDVERLPILTRSNRPRTGLSD